MKLLAGLAKENGITEQEALHKLLLNRQQLKRFVESSYLTERSLNE